MLPRAHGEALRSLFESLVVHVAPGLGEANVAAATKFFVDSAVATHTYPPISNGRKEIAELLAIADKLRAHGFTDDAECLEDALSTLDKATAELHTDSNSGDGIESGAASVIRLLLDMSCDPLGTRSQLLSRPDDVPMPLMRRTLPSPLAIDDVDDALKEWKLEIDNDDVSVYSSELVPSDDDCVEGEVGKQRDVGANVGNTQSPPSTPPVPTASETEGSIGNIPSSALAWADQCADYLCDEGAAVACALRAVLGCPSPAFVVVECPVPSLWCSPAAHFSTALRSTAAQTTPCADAIEAIARGLDSIAAQQQPYKQLRASDTLLKAAGSGSGRAAVLLRRVMPFANALLEIDYAAASVATYSDAGGAGGLGLALNAAAAMSLPRLARNRVPALPATWPWYGPTASSVAREAIAFVERVRVDLVSRLQPSSANTATPLIAAATISDTQTTSISWVSETLTCTRHVEWTSDIATSARAAVATAAAAARADNSPVSSECRGTLPPTLLSFVVATGVAASGLVLLRRVLAAVNAAPNIHVEHSSAPSCSCCGALECRVPNQAAALIAAGTRWPRYAAARLLDALEREVGFETALESAQHCAVHGGETSDHSAGTLPRPSALAVHLLSASMGEFLTGLNEWCHGVHCMGVDEEGLSDIALLQRGSWGSPPVEHPFTSDKLDSALLRVARRWTSSLAALSSNARTMQRLVEAADMDKRTTEPSLDVDTESRVAAQLDVVMLADCAPACFKAVPLFDTPAFRDTVSGVNRLPMPLEACAAVRSSIAVVRAGDALRTGRTRSTAQSLAIHFEPLPAIFRRQLAAVVAAAAVAALQSVSASASDGVSENCADVTVGVMTTTVRDETAAEAIIDAAALAVQTPTREGRGAPLAEKQQSHGEVAQRLTTTPLKPIFSSLTRAGVAEGEGGVSRSSVDAGRGCSATGRFTTAFRGTPRVLQHVSPSAADSMGSSADAIPLNQQVVPPRIAAVRANASVRLSAAGEVTAPKAVVFGAGYVPLPGAARSAWWDIDAQQHTSPAQSRSEERLANAHSVDSQNGDVAAAVRGADDDAGRSGDRKHEASTGGVKEPTSTVDETQSQQGAAARRPTKWHEHADDANVATDNDSAYAAGLFDSDSGTGIGARTSAATVGNNHNHDTDSHDREAECDDDYNEADDCNISTETDDRVHDAVCHSDCACTMLVERFDVEHRLRRTRAAGAAAWSALAAHGDNPLWSVSALTSLLPPPQQVNCLVPAHSTAPHVTATDLGLEPISSILSHCLSNTIRAQVVLTSRAAVRALLEPLALLEHLGALRAVALGGSSSVTDAFSRRLFAGISTGAVSPTSALTAAGRTRVAHRITTWLRAALEPSSLLRDPKHFSVDLVSPQFNAASCDGADVASFLQNGLSIGYSPCSSPPLSDALGWHTGARNSYSAIWGYLLRLRWAMHLIDESLHGASDEREAACRALSLPAVLTTDALHDVLARLHDLSAASRRGGAGHRGSVARTSSSAAPALASALFPLAHRVSLRVYVARDFVRAILAETLGALQTSQWASLCASLRRTADLDYAFHALHSVRLAHDEYMAALLERCLLEPRQAITRQVLVDAVRAAESVGSAAAVAAAAAAAAINAASSLDRLLSPLSLESSSDKAAQLLRNADAIGAAFEDHLESVLASVPVLRDHVFRQSISR